MTGRVSDPRVNDPQARDRLAFDESLGFQDGDLDKQQKKNNFGRRETFQDHLLTAAISFFWVGFFAILATGLVWFYHLLLPSPCHFLDPAQIDKVQAILFSGLLSATLSGIAKKYI